MISAIGVDILPAGGWAYAGGFAGVISLVTLVIKSIYASGTASQSAYIAARTASDAEHAKELAVLKADLERKMKEQSDRHDAEIARIHRALASLIALIPPESAGAAMAIVVELGITQPLPNINQGDTP